MSNNRSGRRGISLIETVVSIAIIGIVMGLLFPVLSAIRERSNTMTCQHNLKQLDLALQQYQQAHKSLPPYASGRENEIIGSWFVHLMPYCGFEAIHNAMQTQTRARTGVRGVRVLAQSDSIGGSEDTLFTGMLCPSDPSGGGTDNLGRINYLANWYAFGDGVSGAYAPVQQLGSFKDGLANTILFAEAYATCDGLPRLATQSSYYHNFGITQEGKPSDDPSYWPNDYTLFQVMPTAGSIPCDKQRTQTPHRLIHVGFADGSVREISGSISPEIWKNLLKPNDGLPAGDDF